MGIRTNNNVRIVNRRSSAKSIAGYHDASPELKWNRVYDDGKDLIFNWSLSNGQARKIILASREAADILQKNADEIDDLPAETDNTKIFKTQHRLFYKFNQPGVFAVEGLGTDWTLFNIIRFPDEEHQTVMFNFNGGNDHKITLSFFKSNERMTPKDKKEPSRWTVVLSYYRPKDRTADFVRPKLSDRESFAQEMTKQLLSLLGQ